MSRPLASTETLMSRAPAASKGTVAPEAQYLKTPVTNGHLSLLVDAADSRIGAFAVIAVTCLSSARVRI